MRSNAVVAALALVFTLAAAGPSGAQQGSGFPGDVPDTFRIRLGSMYGDFSTNFAISGKRGGLGTILNFEDLFDLQTTKTSLRLEGAWRVSERSSLIFGYVGYNRAGERLPEREFEFLGYTVLAGVGVKNEFKAKFTTLAYRYDAYDNGEVRLNGTAGLTYMQMGTRLVTGIGVIGPDGNPLGRGLDESAEINQAVPLVGVGVDWAASPRFATNLYLRGLYINVGGFNGGVTEAGLSGTWFFHRNVGLGLGMERTDVRIKRYEGESFVGRGAYSQLGLKLFLEAAF